THVANAGGGGRWGDYYDICMDPTDDRTYWVVGEYPTRNGWSNWIASFVISDVSCPVDLNGDTLIDFFDILAFLVGFEDQNPNYDWDHDGEFTIFDVILFLGEFEAGC
ncbi:MAG: hypothetical protein KDA28_12755, partial [Phycisphaerales bacterium]|nr:hypothetical protein [Phycisphaerales bacterium]